MQINCREYWWTNNFENRSIFGTVMTKSWLLTYLEHYVQTKIINIIYHHQSLPYSFTPSAASLLSLESPAVSLDTRANSSESINVSCYKYRSVRWLQTISKVYKSFNDIMTCHNVKNQFTTMQALLSYKLMTMTASAFRLHAEILLIKVFSIFQQFPQFLPRDALCIVQSMHYA